MILSVSRRTDIPAFYSKWFFNRMKEGYYKWFEYLAHKLCNYTDKCVISFLDLYKKTERNLKEIKVTPLLKSDMEEMADRLSTIASKYNLILESCSEEIPLDKFGINHGKCIDDKFISKLLGCNINVHKDLNQREVCGCVKGIDIGAYNICKHHCL